MEPGSFKSVGVNFAFFKIGTRTGEWGFGILIALDLIPDMYLTVANVTGNMAVTAVVRGK